MEQKELFEKAKEAKSAEELLSLAKENGMELTDKSGELSDEELDNVAGGGCHKKDGRLIVTVWTSCDEFVCVKCGQKNRGDHFHIIDGYRTNYMQQCQFCKYMSYEGGLWLCNNPVKIK